MLSVWDSKAKESMRIDFMDKRDACRWNENILSSNIGSDVRYFSSPQVREDGRYHEGFYIFCREIRIEEVINFSNNKTSSLILSFGMFFFMKYECLF
jgi:hypothetical protein